MAAPHQFSENAALIAFILQPGSEWNSSVLNTITRTWGPIRHLGKLFPFNKTAYYEQEMGKDLYRGVLSFEMQIAPQLVGDEKIRSNDIERHLSLANCHRLANVDIGYMDMDKIVLPSFKRGPFKLYAGKGLWLDMILTYAKGEFHPTAWAFNDFVQNPYQHDLILIREKYKKAQNVKK